MTSARRDPTALASGSRSRVRAWRAAGAFLALACVVLLPSCRGREGRAPFEARVVGVSDGDSITVLDGTTRVKVRLNGIDCPERRQPFGARAKQLTSELAFGKTVTVRPFGKDRYGRVLGEVVLPDGRVLNEELVAAGMAWHYKRYSKDERLARLERQARRARV
ncbi:MAG: thermonuclease family protein, partial [Thermoanaerobaculia bacterium]|nr:thermonuclease family protein [Thermoanaerobaculia bacterium]